MPEKVRLGCVGLGWWGGVLTEAAAASGAAEVVSCFARTIADRDAFAAAHGCEPAESLDTLLESDIDGVMIATPHSTHGDLVVRAAAAGKHVLVDKPMTLTAAEAVRATQAAADAGIVLQVGHNRRRQIPNRRIKSMIDAGELGIVQHLDATYTVPVRFKPYVPEWRKRRTELPAGAMTPLGVHMVDSFRFLAGPIVRIAAFSKQLMPGGELDDTTTIVFEFAAGPLGHLYTSLSSGPVIDLAVHGTDASAWNLSDGSAMAVQQRGSTERETLEMPPFDAVADEIAEFASAVRGGPPPETGGEEGRAVAAVLEAIVESAATGRVVDVNG